MQTKSLVGEGLQQLIHDNQPEKLTIDGSGDQFGKKTEFMKKCKEILNQSASRHGNGTSQSQCGGRIYPRNPQEIVLHHGPEESAKTIMGLWYAMG
jgi:hypothetical protein